MRTKEEFIRRWRNHLAGMALFGAVSDLRDGQMTRAAKILDIPGEVEKLLGQLWDDLNPKKPEGTK